MIYPSKKSNANTIHTLACFCASALLLGGCSEPTPQPPPKPSAPAAPTVDMQKAKAEAQSDADAMGKSLKSSALDTLKQQITGKVPYPPLKIFPGLKSPRLRVSVDRVKRKTGPKPVLLLMMDTTRADRMSVYGHNRPTTPNLEELHKEAILFSRYYSNGTWTRPSVSSMLTGLYRKHHMIELGGVITKRHPVVAQVFKDNGYATAAFVGNQTVRGTYNFNKGFDHFEDIHDEIKHNPKADEMVDRTIKWLETNDNDNWFIWLFVVDPHDPYNPVSKFDKWETDSKYKKVPTPGFEGRLPKDLHTRMLAMYDAEILQMDDALGTLFTYFKDKGIWDDLSILAVTDHGEAFGEKACLRHPYHPWEPNIHVPFMIKSPEFTTGQGHVEDRLFQSVDIAPTLTDLAGLSAHEKWEGISAADVVSGSMLEGWDRIVYTEQFGYGMRRWVVRQGNYKYLRFNPTNLELLEKSWEKSWESLTTAKNQHTVELLYDLSEDPWEENTLHKKKKGVLKMMRAELTKFIKGKKGKGYAPPTEVSPEELDDQALEDLRALGYIE